MRPDLQCSLHEVNQSLSCARECLRLIIQSLFLFLFQPVSDPVSCHSGDENAGDTDLAATSLFQA